MTLGLGERDSTNRIGCPMNSQAAVSSVARQLGDNGRVLLRPSGTEPVVRVMVEAADRAQADAAAARLVEAVVAASSGPGAGRATGPDPLPG